MKGVIYQARVSLPKCKSDGITISLTSLQRLPVAFGMKAKIPSGFYQVLQEQACAHLSSPSPLSLNSPPCSLVFVQFMNRPGSRTCQYPNVLSQAVPLPGLPFLLSSHIAASVHLSGLSQRVTFSERPLLMTLS